mmetsp:Transcript_19693/g.75545  ORF Transcript_19693/g.75545 Transcript_19693/m.75545 type:complete len:222 (+) Transcript_19693:912-1577(+)
MRLRATSGATQSARRTSRAVRCWASDKSGAEAKTSAQLWRRQRKTSQRQRRTAPQLRSSLSSAPRTEPWRRPQPRASWRRSSCARKPPSTKPRASRASTRRPCSWLGCARAWPSTTWPPPPRWRRTPLASCLSLPSCGRRPSARSCGSWQRRARQQGRQPCASSRERGRGWPQTISCLSGTSMLRWRRRLVRSGPPSSRPSARCSCLVRRTPPPSSASSFV